MRDERWEGEQERWEVEGKDSRDGRWEGEQERWETGGREQEGWEVQVKHREME